MPSAPDDFLVWVEPLDGGHRTSGDIVYGGNAGAGGLAVDMDAGSRIMRPKRDAGGCGALLSISGGTIGTEPRYRSLRTLLLAAPTRQVVLVHLDRRWLPHLVQANGFRACRGRPTNRSDRTLKKSAGNLANSPAAFQISLTIRQVNGRCRSIDPPSAPEPDLIRTVVKGDVVRASRSGSAKAGVSQLCGGARHTDPWKRACA